jgi:hypothetical protein
MKTGELTPGSFLFFYTSRFFFSVSNLVATGRVHWLRVPSVLCDRVYGCMARVHRKKSRLYGGANQYKVAFIETESQANRAAR